MRVQARDGKAARRVLIGMITSKEVLAHIASRWTKQGLFKGEVDNMIAKWCVDYFNQYGKAPRKQIEAIYESWAEGSKNKSLVDGVASFIDSLSGEYTANGINKEYLLDVASTYFNRVRAERLKEEIERAIEINKVDAVWEKIHSTDKLQLGSTGIIDVLQDTQAMREAFEEEVKPLSNYRGALGQFFGRALARDKLISIQAPDKRGKSYWLLDIALNIVENRHKVFYVVVGDMSSNEIIRERLGPRLTGVPLEIDEPVMWPTKIYKDPDDESGIPQVTFKKKTFKSELDWHEVNKAAKRFMSDKVKSKRALLKMAAYPASTVGVPGIKAEIQRLERLGWMPDALVIDYADVLASMLGSHVDSRDQINATWEALRTLSMEYHMLVLTATQSNAAAYGAHTLSMKNFSNDKRKLAHVTGMIGINQTPEEKELDVTRLNWIVLRGAKFDPRKCVYVAGCRPLGQIAVRSCW